MSPLAPKPRPRPRTAKWFQDRGIKPDHVLGFDAVMASGDARVTWESTMEVSVDDLMALAEAADGDDKGE